MHGFDGGWFFGMHALWWLFWLALIVILAVQFNRTSQQRAGLSALERLQQRYANGEISTEEYEERKQTLERDR